MLILLTRTVRSLPYIRYFRLKAWRLLIVFFHCWILRMGKHYPREREPSCRQHSLERSVYRNRVWGEFTWIIHPSVFTGTLRLVVMSLHNTCISYMYKRLSRPTEYSGKMTSLSYHQLDFVILHWNLPITEWQTTKSFSCAGGFCLIRVLELCILGSRGFPLKTGFLHAGVPFKASFTLLMKWNIMIEIKT